MQRLFNLDKWHPIVEGKAVQFELDRPRVVRLDVNVAGTANLYVVGDKKDQLRFLASCSGRDVVEFHVGGPFGLVSDGDPVWIYTVDGDLWTYEDPEPELFVRIHEKRQRNYELEVVMARMAANMEMRLAKQADELARLVERREAARALPPVDTGAAAAAGKQPPAPKGGGAGGDDQKSGKAGKDTGRRNDEE